MKEVDVGSGKKRDDKRLKQNIALEVRGEEN